MKAAGATVNCQFENIISFELLFDTGWHGHWPPSDPSGLIGGQIPGLWLVCFGSSCALIGCHRQLVHVSISWAAPVHSLTSEFNLFSRFKRIFSLKSSGALEENCFQKVTLWSCENSRYSPISLLKILRVNSWVLSMKFST